MGECGTVPNMKRLSLLLAGFALILASCSAAVSENSAEPSTPTDAPLVATSSSVPMEAQVPAPSGAAPSESAPQNPAIAGTTTTAAETTATKPPGPPPDGPAAPDFTLSLGEDGGATFTLSEESKPVFMVFWAEW